jgi:hypothetical protein
MPYKSHIIEGKRNSPSLFSKERGLGGEFFKKGGGEMNYD